MAKAKLFSSVRKLDSLPLGSRVRFGTAPYGKLWRKDEKGWWPIGVTSFSAWAPSLMLAYERNYKFSVDREGDAQSNSSR